MPENKSYSKLKSASAAFNAMLRHFAVVTVMNVKVYDQLKEVLDGTHKVDSILKAYQEATPIAEIDTLKIANITIEGPDKTVTGGQYNNPLVKFGKTARLEMQDALGHCEALEALSGVTLEHFHTSAQETTAHEGESNDVLHVTEEFAGPKTIIGQTFLIDANTGSQVPAYIIIYEFLPDSFFNLTQDGEGDATVFDLNGDLNTVNILVGDEGDADEGGIVTGVFYSVLSTTEIPTVA